MAEQKKTIKRVATKQKEVVAEKEAPTKEPVNLSVEPVSKEGRRRYRELVAERGRLNGQIEQASGRISEINKELSGLK